MTNHWIDLKNSDVLMINGSNAAENHPASMTWINKARDERGAKLIVVDPRFTRSDTIIRGSNGGNPRSSPSYFDTIDERSNSPTVSRTK